MKKGIENIDKILGIEQEPETVVSTFDFKEVSTSGLGTESSDYRFWIKKGPFWRRVGKLISYPDKQKGQLFATRTMEGEPLTTGLNEGDFDLEDKEIPVLSEGDKSKSYKAITQYVHELDTIAQEVAARSLPAHLRREKEEIGNQIAKELQFLVDEVFLDKQGAFLLEIINKAGSMPSREREVVEEMLADSGERLAKELHFGDAQIAQVLESEFSYGKDMDISVAPPQRQAGLEQSLLDHKLRVERGEWKENEKKYANAILTAYQVYGRTTVEEAAQECMAVFDDALINQLGLAPNEFSTSLAWANWDLAKQYYFFLHPEENDPNYKLGNPFDANDPSKKEEIVDRHLGWDIGMKMAFERTDPTPYRVDSIWNAEPEKAEVEEIMSRSAPDGHMPSYELARLGHLVRTIARRSSHP